MRVLLFLKIVSSVVLVGCGLIARSNPDDLFIYSFSTGSAVGQFVEGNIGKFAVHFDRKQLPKTFAIVNMADIADSERKVDLATVSIYANECLGSPAAIFEYNRLSFSQFVLPQSFSISESGCLTIEYFEQSAESLLVLVDRFEIYFVD